MILDTVRFLSLLFTALALIPAGAHLLELPHKIALSATDYLVVQKIYRGWALAGIVVVGALLSTLALVLMLYSQQKPFLLALVAFFCIVGAQIIFWTSTYPVNQQTVNWTVLPTDWLALRKQWEYSHAVSAGLNLVALISLILSVLSKRA